MHANKNENVQSMSESRTWKLIICHWLLPGSGVMTCSLTARCQIAETSRPTEIETLKMIDVFNMKHKRLALLMVKKARKKK